MISAPASRDLLGQVQQLARELVAEVELRCACRCRCHTPIGWATDTPAPCFGIVDAERLDCPYQCRTVRGCELVKPPARLAHR